MNYTALYSTIYRVRNLTRSVAKILAWALGLQLVVLYGLASVADTPLLQLAGPCLRFAAVLAVAIFGPRIFDAALARIAARYRRV
ncbi:hypothetical protein M1V18_004398 [Salmonella enterica]|nr:hypothetical protein [Salmonella enterica]